MRNVFFLFLLYGTISVWAQVKTFLAADIENDFINFRGRGTDCYYTGGHRLIFWEENSKKTCRSFGISITQQTYTPSNLQEINPATLDYPYAGLLFCSLHMLVLIPQKEIRVYNKFSFGTSGPRSGVATLQRTIHRIIGDEIPQGWFLLNSSNEFIQFETQLIYPVFTSKRWHIEVLQKWEGGNYFNHLNSGFRTYWGELPLSNSMFSNYVTHARSNCKKKSSKMATSFVFAADYAQVLRNRILEESAFRETIALRTMPISDFINRSYVHLSLGFGFSFGKTGIYFMQHWQDRETFKLNPHSFGSVQVSYQLSSSN
ncbi:MAG: hypothetical protein RLZ05_1461 [Bacteroidota bacterium]|jgi:hypothetical protein